MSKTALSVLIMLVVATNIIAVFPIYAFADEAAVLIGASSPTNQNTLEKCEDKSGIFLHICKASNFLSARVSKVGILITIWEQGVIFVGIIYLVSVQKLGLILVNLNDWLKTERRQTVYESGALSTKHKIGFDNINEAYRSTILALPATIFIALFIAVVATAGLADNDKSVSIKIVLFVIANLIITSFVFARMFWRIEDRSYGVFDHMIYKGKDAFKFIVAAPFNSSRQSGRSEAVLIFVLYWVTQSAAFVAIFLYDLETLGVNGLIVIFGSLLLLPVSLRRLRKLQTSYIQLLIPAVMIAVQLASYVSPSFILISVPALKNSWLLLQDGRFIGFIAAWPLFCVWYAYRFCLFTKEGDRCELWARRN
jgi:hypothetical protein